MSIYTIANFGFTIWGDGVATSFTYDLANYPFNLPFDKTYPDSVHLTGLSVTKADGSGEVDNSYTASITMIRSAITVVFNKPLVNEPAPPPTTNDGTASVGIQMVFKG